MLNQRVQWHSKKSAKESEQSKMPRSGTKRMARVIEQRAENRHANRTNRNQSVLDLPARKIASRKTSHADSDSHGRLQQTDVRFIHVQHVVPINHDRELQQRRKKPQIRVAHHGPAENAIGSNSLEIQKKIAERIPAKTLRRIGGRDPRERQSRGQPHKR